MTPQELKTSILQLAIQGKLVEQRPEEGTGEELYKRIQAEKQKLIEDGKLKKEKPLPEITEDEVPFEIPENWKWVRFSQICSVLNGDRGKNYPAKSTLTHEGIPFISALNLDGKTVIDDDNLLRMSQAQYDRLGNGKLIKDDIVVCIRGSLGKHGKHPFEKGAIASSLVIVRSLIKDEELSAYIMLYLDSPLMSSEIKKYDNGTAQPNLAAKSLEQFLIPLPPIIEQNRIVAKIEELLPLVERYGEAWTKLEEFNKKFPDDMKKSILQQAIQGKLVEQRPEEGTGEDLYQQVQAEKKELIEAGKLKKEKPLPEITEDEIPFEIPESWKWVRFGDVSSYAQRKEKVSAINISADMWSLDLEDIEKDTGKITNHCLACDRTISGDKVKFKTGNILYSKLRPYLKKVLVAPADGICSSEIVPFVMYGNIEPEYARYFLISPFADGIVNSASYGVKMPRVSTDTMTSLCFPLPPLAEQKRIVAKIEELLPLCEKLK